MADPKRRQVMMGEVHEVDCALLEDGTSPAGEFFDGLKAGALEGDPDSKVDPPDPDQVTDYSWFLNQIKQFANGGVPSYRTAINYLRNGIWEFKHGSKRLTFYDTDGAGGFSAKERYREASESPYPDDPFWFVPDFDKRIRLGHWFFKEGERASEDDLQQAERVRREDLAHDKDKKGGT